MNLDRFLTYRSESFPQLTGYTGYSAITKNAPLTLSEYDNNLAFLFYTASQNNGAALSGVVATLQTDVANLQNDLQQTDNNLSALSSYTITNVFSLSASINTINSTLGPLETYVYSAVPALSAATNILDNRLEIVEGNLIVLSGNLNSLSSFTVTSVNALSGDVSNLYAILSGVPSLSAVSGIVTSVNEISGNLNTVSAYTYTNIPILSGQIAAVSAASSNNAVISSLTANVATLSANQITISGNLNTLSAQVQTLSANSIVSGTQNGDTIRWDYDSNAYVIASGISIDSQEGSGISGYFESSALKSDDPLQLVSDITNDNVGFKHSLFQNAGDSLFLYNNDYFNIGSRELISQTTATLADTGLTFQINYTDEFRANSLTSNYAAQTNLIQLLGTGHTYTYTDVQNVLEDPSDLFTSLRSVYVYDSLNDKVSYTELTQDRYRIKINTSDDNTGGIGFQADSMGDSGGYAHLAVVNYSQLKVGTNDSDSIVVDLPNGALYMLDLGVLGKVLTVKGFNP